ncbi:hypothetical protein FGO68_gene15595 [Halteria grandinella]|uniref:AN1-type domain-containing protein n=1 Tax=Halteria grandinella TaxID=5974 RepID=A0A8J8NHS1_HALGN|nr:hypothetical protein FGO68_gene15595 [Halteria grandinella]
MERSQPNNTPQLCNGCYAFYAYNTTNYLCSKCYKDTVHTAETSNHQPIENTEEKEMPENQAVQEECKDIKEPVAALVINARADGLPFQENTKVCWQCSKRVGLLGFTCKCQYVFCGKHRYAEEHLCTFDHVTQQREILERSNPLVRSEKVKKI